MDDGENLKACCAELEWKSSSFILVRDSKMCDSRNMLSFSDNIKDFHCSCLNIYTALKGFMCIILSVIMNKMPVSSFFSSFFFSKRFKFNIENICLKILSTATCYTISHIQTYISLRNVFPFS